MPEKRYEPWKLTHDQTALLLLLATSIASAACQLSLSPVYGSIPSAEHHAIGVLFCAIFAQMFSLPARNMDLGFIFKCIPIYAFTIPALQNKIFEFSGWWGPEYGPMISECITLYPLVFTTLLYSFCPSRQHESVFKVIFLMVSSYGMIYCTEMKALGFLGKHIGSNVVMTRSGIQYMIAVVYSCLIPSQYLIYAFVIFLGTVAYDPHIPIHSATNLLNSTLNQSDWALIERHESLTGYLSVLRNQKDHYQVMRCDHSLLGGEWLITPERRDEGWVVPEPIYSVFTMLESVRLIEFEDSSYNKPDPIQHALVIGLGIGTSSKALASHGINTTTVEIDPWVHHFATRYFDLPLEQRVIIEDAITYVKAASESRFLYDYIIHDVFTGGAEPLDLFTEEFLTSLKVLLKPQGAIAINYAGDLASPATRIIVNTVRSVFSQCRLFRDNPRAESATIDFVNLVIFCTRRDSKWRFREPVVGDYLKSQARRANIPPRMELDWKEKQDSAHVLRSNGTHVLEKHRRQSAINHWKIMRRAVPDMVWETW